MLHSVAAISSVLLILSAAAIFNIRANEGKCSPRSILPICERSIPASAASSSWATP